MKKEKKREVLVEEIRGLPLEMAPIPAGSFTMGSVSAQAADNESPRREMSLPGFYLGRVTVTKSLWRAVMKPGITRINPNNTYPVQNLSWYRAWEFIARLNRISRLHYRLPTEAEWEYAARAGTRRDRYGPLDEIAWHWKNALTHARQVGLKKPNAFGLYDMLGNVWEPCSDYYAPYPWHEVDPLGPSQGLERVLRGGCWRSYHDGQDCRTSSRMGLMPHEEEKTLGLRLAADWAEQLEPGSLNFRRWLESRFLKNRRGKPALDILALLGGRNLESFWRDCRRPDLMLWLYEQVTPDWKLREYLEKQAKRKKGHPYMKTMQDWTVRARRALKSVDRISGNADSWEDDLVWSPVPRDDRQEFLAQVHRIGWNCSKHLEKFQLAIRTLSAEVESSVDSSIAYSIRNDFPPLQIEGC